MKTYEIRRRDAVGKLLFTVAAETVQSAANLAAPRVSSERSAFAQRLTGDPALSGVFSAYVPDRRANGDRQVGRPFHVRPE